MNCKELLEQQNYLQMCDRDYAAGDAENLQKKNGVFAEVEQQLHRLHHLVRWETGGLYGALAFDYLHTFCLGIFSKWRRPAPLRLVSRHRAFPFS